MKDTFDGISGYDLSDRYTATEGRVFLTGTQALTRIMLDQARRDRKAGLRTAGFVSGYRGSPLGGVDLEMWRGKEMLERNEITFMPAINEDLGATAVLGSQQATLDPDCTHEGVFAMWYGKGPGVDRSGDALKHGNAYGSAQKGGVLVVAGDDHGCVSSSMPHQSDGSFIAWFMPILNPATVAEYLDYGAYGFALSRYSGTWVAFKAVSETVESGASVQLPPERDFATPAFDAPPGGLHVRPVEMPNPEIETRLTHKLRAVRSFVEANPIDRTLHGVGGARFGIVTTGKGHLDTMEALGLLGVDEEKCRALGIDIYKVGMVWPLSERQALDFVRGKQEVLVIEEKRGIIESQLKESFYDWPGDKPERMVGKHDDAGAPLIPWTGELSPRLLLPIIADRLHRFFPEENFPGIARRITETPVPQLNVEGATRTPYFCSGCPHNTSTKLPEGSESGSGIGCHVMAAWMGRNTVGFAQMGAEGVPFVGAAPFNGNKHRFQNLGEGTWYHSGSLAIRQAIAAKANITYKILYNDAVAMTGGQPVDGPVSVQGIANTCRAEGVTRIALVSDTPEKFEERDFPRGLTIHDRSEMDAVQRELREVPGVTVLIYEQTCATEKRRRRKRGTMEDPKRFAWINPLVCEGCGDCSVESNCLSVEPRETEYGRRRKINLSTCNKDFSCLNGFCPSFVTLEGAVRRKKDGADVDAEKLAGRLPQPDLPPLDRTYDLLVTGVGGTGVVTIGALITMAAHLEGKESSVLDFTGFAQKFGTVLSYIRLAGKGGRVNQVRIDNASADAVIGGDVVVSSAPKASAHYRKGTRMVLNLAEMPTGDLVLKRDASLKVDTRVQTIAKTLGGEPPAFDANRMAEHLLGDAVFANVMLLGFAWQHGLVPVTEEGIKRAMELNGVAVEKNRRAFDFGRVMAGAPESLPEPGAVEAPSEDDPDAVIEHRAAYLEEYQDAKYARDYRDRMAAFRAALPEGAPADIAGLAAKGLFRVMAAKDEYEVARLQTSDWFRRELEREFEEGFTVNYHLAPPVLNFSQDGRGRPKKRQFGRWMTPGLKVLARMKGLRGTPFDPFRYTSEGRAHARLKAWYRGAMEQAARGWSEANDARVREVLSLPMEVRGYGPVREQALRDRLPAAESALAAL